MGWDLWSVGRHSLRLGDVKSVAKQLSEALDINIEYGQDRHGWSTRKVLGQIIVHKVAPIYTLDRMLSYNYTRFELDSPDDVEQTSNDKIVYLDIYNETISISFKGWPWRWWHYYSFFSDEQESPSLENLNTFRRTAKEYYGKLGAKSIYCFADQGPTSNIGDHWEEPWEQFEDYILSGMYYDECSDPDYKGWRKKARLMNVSNFLSGEDPTLSKNYGDIFFDDFSDLD